MTSAAVPPARVSAPPVDASADPSHADAVAAGLASYLDASPSPFHAVATAGELLAGGGFVELEEVDAVPTEPGRYFWRRGGSLIAWDSRSAAGPTTPFRVVGAHTDSPTLRIKPQHEGSSAGWRTLGVEVYGGPLLNSWLDRDLGLSGRIAHRGPSGVTSSLVRIDEPLLRVSQLAPHLDRSVNEALRLNPQQHLVPHWAVDDAASEAVTLHALLAERLGIGIDDVLALDLITHDLTPARRTGADRATLASARLDNLATSYAAVRALLAAAESPATAPTGPVVPVIALFDHEEVGSTSERGAGSSFLPATMERIVLAAGGGREDLLRALAGTVIASGDMAHATNPNHAERHEPAHRVRMNGGPVLKINANLRYATDAVGAAHFRYACDQVGSPVQTFVTRTDLPCGSTVGPMTSALTGATTVDFGAPTLSMHSTRELCGVQDQVWYGDVLAAFLAPR